MYELDMFVVRHGETPYAQGNQPRALDDAFDLTPNGEIRTRQSTLALLPFLNRQRAVQILSSPAGRTLHTAKVIREALEAHAVQIRGIESRSELREGENFTWRIFTPLVEGGRVDWEGTVFTVDPRESNPTSQDASEYFFRDSAHCIPRIVKARWPRSFVEQLERFERCGSVTRRMFGFLHALCQLPWEDQVVLVTHEALTCAVVAAFTRERKVGLARSEFMQLRLEAGALIVQHVAGVTRGERIDVLKLTV